MTQSAVIQSSLLTVEEAALYTRLSPSSLYTKCRRRQIPHVKLGRLIMFDKAELDKWIKQNAVMPLPEKTAA